MTQRYVDFHVMSITLLRNVIHSHSSRQAGYVLSQGYVSLVVPRQPSVRPRHVHPLLTLLDSEVCGNLQVQLLFMPQFRFVWPPVHAEFLDVLTCCIISLSCLISSSRLSVTGRALMTALT